MPASNMKILTLAAAADSLDWDYRFTTTLEARGTVSNGILHGDLVVKSNGEAEVDLGFQLPTVLNERGVEPRVTLQGDGHGLDDEVRIGHIRSHPLAGLERSAQAHCRAGLSRSS